MAGMVKLNLMSGASPFRGPCHDLRPTAHIARVCHDSDDAPLSHTWQPNLSQHGLGLRSQAVRLELFVR